MDGLALGEHVWVLLARRLVGGQPLQGRALGRGSVVDTDPELGGHGARQLDLQLLPEPAGGPVLEIQHLARGLLRHLGDGQAPGVEDNGVGGLVQLLQREDDMPVKNLVLEVDLDLEVDMGGLDEVRPGVGVGIHWTQTHGGHGGGVRRASDCPQQESENT